MTRRIYKAGAPIQFGAVVSVWDDYTIRPISGESLRRAVGFAVRDIDEGETIGNRDIIRAARVVDGKFTATEYLDLETLP